ncbi:Acyl CoA binding protein [Pyrenophora tritici-repentis]|uniref:Acyl CoA binding protein n=1 Tax=Pyrenophora tritici-repentis TaxID=45151 RepID=A0A922SZ23_9PLEO|nr:Acyl CoA binding protein [Pyrenophora tritici-repentis]KAI1673114.1 Acyl CoA binding protein [Pyrenophora tritici-repentis]KAI1677053.1 Acyl CoA binding protein [Pyrenophora tritici-repentis]
MTGAKFQEVYKKVSDMGTRLKKEGKSGPSNDEQLQLYGYAKIAEGKDFSAASKPGMFDMAGKAKYNKWKEFVDAGMSQKDAEDKYVKVGEDILAKYDV